MTIIKTVSARRMRGVRPLLALIALSPLAGLASPVSAQITTSPGTPAPTMSVAEREQMNAQTMLTGALQRIASNGNDVNALIDAGYAANIIGDANAAYGFLNRALSLSPNNGRIRAGLGIALVKLENPVEAIRMFDAAVQQGVSERIFLAERALAYDLIGENAKAQRDYQLALQSNYSDATLRNYALSLGISGDTERAVQQIAPLLQKKDRAAWRDRAFILAMNGRTKEALEIVKTTMPANVANGVTPYITKMNRLSNRQMALAVHYGQFPTSDTQLAAVGRGAGAAPAAAPAAKAQTAAASTRGKPTRERPTRNTRTAAATPANDPLRGKRFVDENGREIKLSRSEQLAILREEEKKKADAAALAQRQQAEAKRVADASAAETARQAEAKRIADAAAAEQARQAEARRVADAAAAERTRQAEATRVATAAAAAEQARQAEARRVADAAAAAERARQEEAARLAAATPIAPPVPSVPVQTPPVQTAMVTTPNVPPPAVTGPVMGPVDRGQSPIVSAVPTPGSSTIASTAIPASTVSNPARPGFSEPTAAVAAPPSTLPASPPPPATGESTFKAFSLDELVQAVRPPEIVPTRSEAPVDLATLEGLRQDKIRADREAAATRRADAEKKRLADAKAAKEGGASEPAASAADVRKNNPARTWVQIATGAANVMAGEYRRLSAGKNATIFRGQSGSTAPFGRSQRLLVGPFDNSREANTWLASFKKNGGNGFLWTSAAGEEVKPVGRR